MTSLGEARARKRHGIAAVLLLVLGVLAIAAPIAMTNERKQSPMTNAERVRENLIPPIDRESPADTQTATFALG